MNLKSLVLTAVLISPLMLSGEVSAQYYQQQNWNNGYVNSRPSWTNKMFTKKVHDYGTVARASKQVAIFEFVNPTKQNITLGGVRASCGCAEPKILDRVVKPGEKGRVQVNFNTIRDRCFASSHESDGVEKGRVQVNFNTIRFVGARKATITVSINQPQWVEVQLTIKGTIRQDIVVDPGKVDFKVVKSGTQSVKEFDILYAGSELWKIKSFASSNPNLKVELKETKRGGGLVNYRAKVTLADSQSAGYLTDQILFETNDNRLQKFPVSVSGYVKPTIEAPEILSIGEVKQGDKITKKIFVKSVSEFKILTASCKDKRVTIQYGDKSRKLHILSFTIDCNSSDKFDEDVLIQTSLTQAKIKLMGNLFLVVLDIYWNIGAKFQLYVFFSSFDDSFANIP